MIANESGYVHTVARMPDDLLTTSELARALGVSLRSVQRWIKDGKIQPEHRTPGGHYRWDPDKVREQLRRMYE